jgi:hypothetical protein
LATITDQNAARAVQGLEFCFLCGGEFRIETPELTKTLDHIPAKTTFAGSDRSFPLQVPAHQKCNEGWSQRDDASAELIAVLHGERKPPQKPALEFRLCENAVTGGTQFGVGGVNLERLVIRWVRGCHAALYREFLPDEGPTLFCVSLPMPRLLSGPNAVPLMRGLQRNHLDFVEVIKKNRKAGRLDRIECNNGKFTYECVWSRADDGRECCVFALRLYDWQKLGPAGRPTSSCVGLYLPAYGRPASGTLEAAIEISIVSLDSLNAF